MYVMRKYINSKNEEVEVSEEHLRIAVSLKKELQKSSPSRKCNWSLHKNLMQKEGFYDSDKNENYRQLVKQFQKSIGELPEVKKYANYVADGKLNSIKELVGEIAYEKREVQHYLKEINKGKRELIDFGLVVEHVEKAFENININTIHNESTPLNKTDRSMLVLPADWHIGYFNNNYNHEVAIERVNKYLDKIIEYACIFDINVFHVQHLGDIIENLYMHKNSQSYNSEFTMAEQIVKATELLFTLIARLSSYGEVVFHGVVRGNHGRMSAKGETIPNDCAEYIVHQSIKSLINISNNPRVIVDDSEYNIERSMITIKDKRIKCTHGDMDGQNDRDKIQKHISLENEIIDILALGHFHNFQLKSENHGRLVYGSGCLQGTTEHGKSLKYDNPASQGVIIIGNSEIIPINIILE